MTPDLKTNKRDVDPVANYMKQVEPFDIFSKGSDYETHLPRKAQRLWLSASISSTMKKYLSIHQDCFTIASPFRRASSCNADQVFLIPPSLPLFSPHA